LSLPSGHKKSPRHDPEGSASGRNTDFYGQEFPIFSSGRSSDSRINRQPRLPIPPQQIHPPRRDSDIMQLLSPFTAMAHRYGLAPYSLFTALKFQGRHRKNSFFHINTANWSRNH